MAKNCTPPLEFSRRDFVRRCAAGAASAFSDAIFPLPRVSVAQTARPMSAEVWSLPLNGDWLFGGKLRDDAALQPGFDDASFSRVTLPHSVVGLSWQKWDPAIWEDVWMYRRHFELPKELKNQRIFLHFDGVMVGTTPVVNGHALPPHLGGYLPFEYEITEWLEGGENILAVAIDSRWSNVPPEGSPRGPASIDYLEPGGIVRPVSLMAVPQTFISDVFARPVEVLNAVKRVEIECSINSVAPPPRRMRIEAALRDGERVLSRDSCAVRVEQTGETSVSLTLSNLGSIQLWDADSPRLYEVVVMLQANERPVHIKRLRVGFRDARFEVDGFFLNGKRIRVFGLDRHELYPYVGFAMPERALRRDAEILRHHFNCNFVRCSHYPQSEAFLEACDELGLMVWEELPGWQYLGDQTWRDRAVRDVKQMVLRDRNHPSVVIWGVRINESPNDPALYRKTREAAKSLDDTRPTSGTMTRASTKDWDQDVFAYDDYHAAPDGSVDIAPPLPGVPYLVTEAVGQFNYAARKGFDSKYRRAGDVHLQEKQAILHAQAHSRAANYSRCAGLIAWCAFDYGSQMNSYAGVKCPGVADIFRIPKLGASFYLAQRDPPTGAVIEPDFYWDFGPRTPSGPGKNAVIFSNCERLEVFLDGKHRASVRADRANFSGLRYPPFFTDLEVDVRPGDFPELRIDGYLGETLLLSRSFSSDRTKDQILLRADDAKLVADGADATRLVFQAADRFGAPGPFAEKPVTLAISGPGIIVGDNPFELGDNGGAGAVWIRGLEGKSGRIKVSASHPKLGRKSVELESVLR
jgi:beta-galactosidase